MTADTSASGARPIARRELRETRYRFPCCFTSVVVGAVNVAPKPLFRLEGGAAGPVLIEPTEP